MVDQIFEANSGRGQLMERLTFVQTPAHALDAIYLRGDRSPPLLICPALFEPGGGMEGPLANELAYSSALQGHASLRFAWRGQAASQGELPSSEHGAAQAAELVLDDIQSSLEHLQETTDLKRIAVAGLRDGAWGAISLARARPVEVELILLIDPPPSVVQELPERATFLIFPGDEPVDSAFDAIRETKPIHRIPKADKSFRRGLGELGKLVANLLGRAR